MKPEIRYYFLPLLIIFTLVSTTWVFAHTPFLEIIFLLLGFLTGALFLDLEPFIYWYVTSPKADESQIAQKAIANRDYLATAKLLQISLRTRHSFIFHHYFAQAFLVLISFFIFTSSANSFAKSFLFSLNFHLLIDEYLDYRLDPKRLQRWLFANEDKQLKIEYLKHYLMAYLLINLIFLGLLIKSQA